MTAQDRPSGCGCRACGGRDARVEDEALARRVLAYAPFVRATHPGETADRVILRDGVEPGWQPCQRSSFDMHWCVAHEAVLPDGAWCEATAARADAPRR